MAKDKISGKIVTLYATLEEMGDTRLVYALVSWNDRPPKDEIRQTWKDSDGVEHLGKGIAINRQQMKRLVKAFKKLEEYEPADEEDDLVEPDKGVDFAKIFNEASIISDMRAAGNPTEDGFIRLSYRPGMTPAKLKSLFKPN